MKAVHLLAVACVALSALGGAAQAQAPDSLRALLVTAENVSAAESKASRVGDASVLRPGDVVRYRLTFTNISADSVRNVRFNDPVPAGLRYVAGSARADRTDVLIEFSADGGRTYSERPETEEIVNGQRVRRPLPPESYTHVRWSGRGWVRPRGKVTSEFSVRLPEISGSAAKR